MTRFVLLGVFAISACSSAPPPTSPLGNATTLAAAQKGPLTSEPAYQAKNATEALGSDVAVPKIDLGSPLPVVRVNDIRFSDPNSGMSAEPGQPGQANGATNPGSPSTPGPMMTKSSTGASPLMPGASPPSAQQGQLPTLLGIGHGGSSLWALVNDNAHAILRVGDTIGGTKVASISEAGVALADGREMTVAWTGAGGTGSNGVPNIDAGPNSRTLPSSGSSMPTMPLTPNASAAQANALPQATQVPPASIVTAQPIVQAMPVAPAAGAIGINAPVNGMATPSAFQNTPPTTSGITP